MSSRISKFLAVLAFGVVITLTGTAFTWFQVMQSELNDTAIAATQAVRASERFLDEAHSAATLAHPLLLRSCTPETRTELGRLAIGIEHIRVISLFRQNYMTCSSWSGAQAVRENIPAGADHTVTLLNDDYISPGVPVVVLRTPFSEGAVTTSMTTHWFATVLRLLSITRPLSLQAGNMTLTGDNRLHANGSHNEESLYTVRSGRYSFSVEYDSSRFVPVARLLREGYVSLIMSGMLGIVAATVLWLLAFRRRTPYEQLAVAIEKDEIVPWYQPVIDSKTGSITGVEVLARLVKPDGTVITPDRFIPLAEDSDLIVPLTRSLMAQTARELSNLLKTTDVCWHIGINVTQAHVLEPGFVAECLIFMDTFAPGNIRLTVELTEREPFNSSPEMQAKLRRLHDNGIAVALDDFGTGYANLEYISEVDVDIIKIDRAFVRRIGNGKSGEQLLTCLIDMASALELRMIAEGVETQEQAAWLASRGIYWHQGYLYSRPVPLKALHSMVRNDNC